MAVVNRICLYKNYLTKISSMCKFTFLYFIFGFQVFCAGTSSNITYNISMEQQLHDQITNAYLFPVRPVSKYNDQLIVYLRFALLQILELNLKDQMLSIRLQVEMEWTADRFKWNSTEFHLTKVYFPSVQLWQPDISLYEPQTNLNFQGKYAEIQSNGRIIWKPVVLIEGNCAMKVDYYPFDIQTCRLVFGSWTYEGSLLWITFKDLPEHQQLSSTGVNLSLGMDLSHFVPSTEWSLISLPGKFSVKEYDGFNSSFPHIDFTLTLRRHAKFYLYNLVIPLIGLSYLCLLVFYLPADSGEKITLCLNLLTAQIMFLVLMIDNIPVTSLAVPLLGKLIIFNMVLIFCSIFCSTIVLNLHCRKDSTHSLPAWVVRVNQSRAVNNLFLYPPTDSRARVKAHTVSTTKQILEKMAAFSRVKIEVECTCPKFPKTLVDNIVCIKNHFKERVANDKISQHWKLLAAILDRIFFIVFHIIYIIFMIYFFSEAPALYNNEEL